MDNNFVPQFTCRFRIREDIDCHIGYFESGGVLTFNDIGSFIVRCINGRNSIQEIARQLNEEFPEVESPIGEVQDIIQQLQDCGFLSKPAMAG